MDPCKKHYRYQAIRAPRTNCKFCVEFYVARKTIVLNRLITDGAIILLNKKYITKILTDISKATQKFDRSTYIDWIYNTVDDLLLAGKFAEVDVILKCVDIKIETTSGLLSYLTVTQPWHNTLKALPDFKTRVKAEIESRKLNDDDTEAYSTGLI